MSHQAALPGPPPNDAHVVEPEREQHRLLEPLVDPPVAVRALLGDARLAAVEQVERRLDRLAHRALGGRADAVALLESVVDGLGELGVGHGEFLGPGWPRVVENRAGEVKRPRAWRARKSFLRLRPDALVLPALSRECRGMKMIVKIARAGFLARAGLRDRSGARPSRHGRHDAGDVHGRACSPGSAIRSSGLITWPPSLPSGAWRRRSGEASGSSPAM